jgi:hypothetical protein
VNNQRPLHPAEIRNLDRFVRGRRENLVSAMATAPVTII